MAIRYEWADERVVLSTIDSPPRNALDMYGFRDLAEALGLARRITVNAPLAVQATKESVLRGLALDDEAALEPENELASKVFRSEDAKEGPRAFAEKRPPVWSGR